MDVRYIFFHLYKNILIPSIHYTHELSRGTVGLGTMALSPPLGVASEADDVLAMAADELSVQVTPAVLEHGAMDISLFRRPSN